MSLRPPHTDHISAENHHAAANADAAMAMLEHTSRRMNDLARELDCLWYYGDEIMHDDDSPSAA